MCASNAIRQVFVFQVRRNNLFNLLKSIARQTRCLPLIRLPIFKIYFNHDLFGIINLWVGMITGTKNRGKSGIDESPTEIIAVVTCRLIQGLHARLLFSISHSFYIDSSAPELKVLATRQILPRDDPHDLL